MVKQYSTSPQRGGFKPINHAARNKNQAENKIRLKRLLRNLERQNKQAGKRQPRDPVEKS